MSGYTTDSLTVNHSGQRVWGVARFLHAKDLFYNMAPHLLRPVLFTSTQCSTYVYEYTHESIIRLLLIISPVTTGKILLITKQKSI
jgi:hypothetical protein